jgi:hypothetical protein
MAGRSASRTATKPTTRTQTQIVRIGGVRTKLTTRGGKVTARPARPLEWELQAAQVRRLLAMPEYGTHFLLAGDQNAAKRGPRAQVEALAAGMTAGEPDLRVYGTGGRVWLIENKVGRAALTDSQRERHPALAAIGHPVTIVRAVTCDEAADKAEALVRGWLGENNAANDNKAVDGLGARAYK